MAAGGIGACLAGLVLLAFCYTSRRNRRLEVERSARQEQDYARGLALWSELKTLAAASSSGSGGSSKSPHAFGNLIDKSPAYAMSPIARLAYDPSSPSANNDKEDDLESEGSYSLDGTKRHPPPPLHARNKSYAESFVDPDAAAMELKHSLTEKSSWKRRLPSSQAIMQLGADAPPVPPMPTGANKQAWVGQWAAAQVPPSELGPIDRSSRLTEMDARKTIGALTMALDGDDEDERSDAQTSVSRRVRVPPVSPTDVHQDVPIDMDDERSVRDTVWL